MKMFPKWHRCGWRRVCRGVAGLLMLLLWWVVSPARREFVYRVGPESTYRDLFSVYMKQYFPLSVKDLELFNGCLPDYEHIPFLMEDAWGRRVPFQPSMLYSGEQFNRIFFFDADTPDKVCIHGWNKGVLVFCSFHLADKEAIADYLRQDMQRFEKERGALHWAVFALAPEHVDMRLASHVELLHYLGEVLPHSPEVAWYIAPAGGEFHTH